MMHWLRRGSGVTWAHLETNVDHLTRIAQMRHLEWYLTLDRWREDLFYL